MNFNKGLELLTCNSSINLVGLMKYMMQGNLSKGIDRKTLCLHFELKHGLLTPRESFFFKNPKLLGLDRQIGLINLGHLGYLGPN